MSYNMENVKSKVSSGDALIVDVREHEEWIQGHLDKAVLAPLSQLQNDIIPDELPVDKELYLYCVAGVRSAMAANILTAKGYTKAISLNEGIEELKSLGF